MCSPAKAVQASSLTISILEAAIIIAFIGTVTYFVLKKKYANLKYMAISTVAILAFELIIHPAVINSGFSSWTYLYQDITVVLTMGWVMLVGVSIALVDFAFGHLSELKRFWLYLALLDAFVLLFEILFTRLGLRSYIPALAESRYGLYLPFTAIPIGIALATPAMLALVIAFTKYWVRISGRS